MTIDSDKETSNDTARVWIQDADYDRLEPAFDRMVRDLELEAWFSGLKGKKVFVKPNMLGLFPPERHVTTHPPLVALIVKRLREVGAEVEVGDNCGVGGYGLSHRVAKLTGILAAADGAWVNVAQDTVQVPLDSRYMDQIVVSRGMVEADVLISLPKLKTHSLTILTGGVKNMFGLVAGAGKGRAHAAAPGLKDFGRILADIYSIRPPDLSIMDAIVAMEGNGPSGGKLKYVGQLMAARNAVALDAVAAKMIGLPPGEVHHLRSAARRGLGPIDLEKIEVIGEVPAIKFKLPTTIHRFSCVGRFVNQRFFRPMSQSKLWLDRKKCKKCKVCVDGCPTGAMHFDDRRTGNHDRGADNHNRGADNLVGYPWVDETVCIKCLCCQELCPETAWQVRGLLGRFQRVRRQGG